MELSRHHIENLVKNFYQKIEEDDLLGPVFNEVAKVDWDHHIPLICQFWNSIMLKTNEYHGNAYMKHITLGKLTEIQDAHFTRWLTLFKQEAMKHLPEKWAKEIIDRSILIAASLRHGLLKEDLGSAASHSALREL